MLVVVKMPQLNEDIELKEGRVLEDVLNNRGFDLSKDVII